MPEALTAVRWRKEGDVVVVQFTESHIADLEYIQRARKELRQLAETVGGKMIVSLKNVRFMASSGLGLLVEIHKLRQRSNAQLKICDMQPLIKEAFISTKMERLLGIYNTQAEAVAAFTAGESRQTGGQTP